MPKKLTQDYATTGDIARLVGVDDLTVRRYLEDRGMFPSQGCQYRFSPSERDYWVARLNAARLLYGKHLRRYENDPHRLFTVEILLSN